MGGIFIFGEIFVQNNLLTSKHERLIYSNIIQLNIEFKKRINDTT